MMSRTKFNYFQKKKKSPERSIKNHQSLMCRIRIIDFPQDQKIHKALRAAKASVGFKNRDKFATLLSKVLWI